MTEQTESTKLAPHGGCNWNGCKTCNPDKSEIVPARVRRYLKSPESIEEANRGKLLDWRTSDEMSGFVTIKWGNLQIDPDQVRPGDVLLLAMKDEVIVGSARNRMIARYDTITVRWPAKCVQDNIWHGMSVCTQCIHESWLWDYFFRNTRLMSDFAHGTPRGYDAFGCRCDDCIRAHRAYLNDTTRPYSPTSVPQLGS